MQRADQECERRVFYSDAVEDIAAFIAGSPVRVIR
jgi:hypothetical protein